jgi:biotin carboxylase
MEAKTRSLRRSSQPANGEPAVTRGPLLVLGAGQGQLPVYLEARRRGIATIAVDRRPDAPALRYADEHLPVSILSPTEIVAALGERAPAAVTAGAGELGMWGWQRLSEHYRTPYRYPRSAAEATTDKAVFHEIAARAGVNTYRWRQGTDLARLAAQAAEIGFPLVAKPADGAGKKGVALARDPAGLPAALDYAARGSRSGSVIIEQFLTGRDLTIDVFLRDGEAVFAAVHEKVTDPDNSFCVRGHVTPAELDAGTTGRLVDTAVLLCREIGLTDGPADFDAFVDEHGGIQVVEINARLPGEGVPALVRAGYGVDLVAGLVSLVLGEPVDLRPRRDGTAILHMLASPLRVPGVFQGARGVAEVRRLPGVAGCEFYVVPGTAVPPFPQLGHEVGYVVVSGADRAAAEAARDAALRVVEVTIVPQPAGEPVALTVPSPSAAAPVQPHRSGAARDV